MPEVSVKLGGMLNRGAALNFRELPAPPRPRAVPQLVLFPSSWSRQVLACAGPTRSSSARRRAIAA
jgi:hypothetical protein